jgi:radical SAM protein with 4Fe4S-binding SPASM domain
LLTTGLLLNKRAADVAELFDDVIISLDGPALIHDAIRRVSGAFQLIEDGVSAVRSYRGDMPISGRTTVQKANHHSLLETVASAKKIGLDSLSFLAADLTSEAFNRPLQWSPARQSEVALTPQELCELDREMERLICTYAEEIRSGYISESATKLRRIVAHFRAHIEQGVEESPRCNAPWKSAVIETDGSVRPCFFHSAIGNIHDASLDAVVNGEKAQDFRRGLDMANNPICRRCVCSLNCRAGEVSEAHSGRSANNSVE